MSEMEQLEPTMQLLADCLGKAFEAIVGARPGVRWTEVSRESLPSEGVWYRQIFSLNPDSGLEMDLSGAPWDIAMRQRACDVGDHEGSPQEIFYRDLMTALAGALSRRNSSPVVCVRTERVKVLPNPVHVLRLQLSFNAISPLDVLIAVEQGLAESLRPLVASPARRSEKPARPALEHEFRTPPDERFSLLADVELQVSASFGGARLALRDVLKLDVGSIVELNRTVNDPVQVIVNNRVVASGEVVVVDGNYGVRILDVLGAKVRGQSVGA